MERSDAIYLNIDHLQLGVGGNNSWGKTALPAYQLKSKQAAYAYRILPIRNKQSVDSFVRFPANEATRVRTAAFLDFELVGENQISFP